MTTDEAIDVLIKRGSNNDSEGEALEVLAFKAQAFDLLKNLARMSAHTYGDGIILNVSGKSFNIYELAEIRILKKAFEL